MPISPAGSVTPLTWVTTGLPSGAGPVPVSLPHAVKEAIAATAATAEIRILYIRLSLHEGKRDTSGAAPYAYRAPGAGCQLTQYERPVVATVTATDRRR